MNRKIFLIAIPILLLPYLTLFVLATIFFSTRLPFFEFIMESVFQGNALYLIAALLIYCILAAALGIVYFIVSIRKKWDAFLLCRISVIVKLIQVPAYVLIFVLGVLFSITIFTIPFSIVLYLIDCLSVFLTGLWTISSVINTIRQDIFKPKDMIWVTILQFTFCADVVSSVIYYRMLQRINRQVPNNETLHPNSD